LFHIIERSERPNNRFGSLLSMACNAIYTITKSKHVSLPTNQSRLERSEMGHFHFLLPLLPLLPLPPLGAVYVDEPLPLL
jgi:hypothetical protein